MPDSITKQITLTEKEYFAYLNAVDMGAFSDENEAAKSRTIFRAFYCLISVLSVVFLGLLQISGQIESLDAFSFGLGVVYSAFMYYALRWIIWQFGSYARRYFKSIHASEEREYTFDRTGVSWNSEGRRSFTSWSCILKLFEDKTQLLLFIDPTQAFVIPKRVFENNDELKGTMTKIEKFLADNKQSN